MDCSALPELQTSSKRRPSPIYSTPRAAGSRPRQNSHASQKGRTGDPWGSSAGNVLVRSHSCCLVWSAVMQSHLTATLTLQAQIALNACQ
ncbi:hypothetical protein AAY473_018952 [Plecturocebus cupreus]